MTETSSRRRSAASTLRREHLFSSGPMGDRAACSCGWDHGSRMGVVRVARERHRHHVAEVLALAKQDGNLR